MTAFPGLDSAYGPSLSVAQQARAAGIYFWFGYLGGLGAFHQWTPDEWAILEETGLVPGCLWVPSLGLTENPANAARDAVTVADKLGLYGAVMLDTERIMQSTGRVAGFVSAFYSTVVSLGRPCPTYAGAGYVPGGSAPFLPEWGSSILPSAGQCIQYGPAIRFGKSVDVDLCGPQFPLASFTRPTPPKPAPPVPIPPTPPTPPPVLEVPDMLYWYANSASDDGSVAENTQWVIDGGVRWQVVDPGPVAAKLGAPEAVSGNQVTMIPSV